MAPTANNLRSIARAYGSAEAALVVARLESCGFIVTTTARHTACVAWNWSMALGGVDIQVPGSQADDAMVILAGYETDYRRPNLLKVLFFLAAWLWCSVPPPPSGLFLARTTVTRET